MRNFNLKIISILLGSQWWILLLYDAARNLEMRQIMYGPHQQLTEILQFSFCDFALIDSHQFKASFVN